MSETKRSRPKTSAPKGSEATMPEMYVDPPIGKYLVVSSSSLNLLCGMGELGDRSILTPFLQLRLFKPDENPVPSDDEHAMTEAFEATMTFENAAFLLMDLTRDFYGTTSRLSAMSSGDLKPEVQRILYSMAVLDRAKTFMERTLEELAGIANDARPPPKPAKTKLKRVAAKPAKPRPKS